jgi:hypothetical protein
MMEKTEYVPLFYEKNEDIRDRICSIIFNGTYLSDFQKQLNLQQFAS